MLKLLFLNYFQCLIIFPFILNMIVIDYTSGLLFHASQRFFFFLMRHIIISNDSYGYLFLDNFPSLPLINSKIHLRTLTNGRLDIDQVQLDV